MTLHSFGSKAQVKGYSSVTHLLHLELDGRLKVGDLCLHVILMSKQRRELAGFVEPGSEEPWDLLDQRLRRQESIVLLRQFFDELLLLVKLFEVLGTHEGNALSLRLIAVLLVAEHAHGELRARHVTQPVRRERRNTIYIVPDKSMDESPQFLRVGHPGRGSVI